MTITSPVTLPRPPYERPQPRVTVTAHPGAVNAGDGRETQFALRFVVDARQRVRVNADTRTLAAERGAALVRDREPRAVWLLDADRTRGGIDRNQTHGGPDGNQTRGGLYASSRVWRPLALAARDVGAAYVAWQAS